MAHIYWNRGLKQEALDQVGEQWMHWIRSRDEFLWWQWYFKCEEPWHNAFIKIAEKNIFG